MSKPTFTIKDGDYRIDIACDQCKDGMDATRNPFGYRLVASFADLHKCQTPRKS